MFELHELKLFARIVDLGSISAAARELGLPKSSASRALARLETELDVRLIQRSTRRLMPTEDGLLLREHAERILETVDDARDALDRRTRTVSGTVRLSAPYALGQVLLVPLLPRLVEEHPALRVELRLSADRVDPIADGIDIALRAGALPDSGLVARRLLTAPSMLVASPAYLERRGAPGRPDDLLDHALLDVPRPPAARRWTMSKDGRERSVEVSPSIVVNDPSTLRDVLMRDAGIGWLPAFVAAEDVRDGRLAVVLSQWTLTGTAIHAVFPSRQGLSPKIRLIVDALAERAADLERVRAIASANAR